MGSNRIQRLPKAWAIFSLACLGGPLLAEAAPQGKQRLVPAFPVEACHQALPPALPIATLGEDVFLLGPAAPQKSAPPCAEITIALPGGFLPSPAARVGAAQGLALYQIEGGGGNVDLLGIVPTPINPIDRAQPEGEAGLGFWLDDRGRAGGVYGAEGWRSGADILLAIEEMGQLPGLGALSAAVKSAESKPGAVLVTGSKPKALAEGLSQGGIKVVEAPWPIQELEALGQSASMAGLELAISQGEGALYISPATQWSPDFGRPEARLLGAQLTGGRFEVTHPEDPALALALVPIYQGLFAALSQPPGTPKREAQLEAFWGELGSLFQSQLGLSLEGRASLLGMRGGLAILLAEGAPPLKGDDNTKGAWLARGVGDLNGALTLASPQSALKGRLLGDRAYLVALSKTSGIDEIELALMDIDHALTLLPREGRGTEWALLKWTEGQLLGRLSGLERGPSSGPISTLEQSREAFGWALNRFTPAGDSLAFGTLSIDLGEALLEGSKGDRRQVYQGVQAIEKGVAHLDLDHHPRGAVDGLISFVEGSTRLPFADDGEIIEGAISASELALGVIDKSAAPYPWATLQTLRGYAYQVRLLGNRDFRVDTAIEAYTLALTVFREDTYPEEWSKATVNLASAWLQRTLGESEENNARARALLGEVLAKGEALGDARLIATAYNNLGLAWLRRSGGDRLDNLNKAGAAFSSALTPLEGGTFPEDRAQSEANLEIARFYIAAEELMRGNPGTSRATAALGDALLLEGLQYREWILLTQGEDRFRQAVERYEAAIAIEPDISLNYHKRSVALWKLLEVDEALKAERAALELDPENLLFATWLTFLEGKSLLMKDSGSGEGHRKLGQFHLAHWELPQALDEFQRAWNADKSLIDVPGEMARILVNLERPEEAFEIAKVGLKEVPTHFELNAIAHSIAFEILHDFQGALPFAEAMVALVGEPDMALSLTRLENHLAVGGFKVVRKEGRALRGDVQGGEGVVLSALLWLERRASGKKSKAEAKALIDAYEGLDIGEATPWSMGGLMHWVEEGEWDKGGVATGVLKVLSSPRSEEGLSTLKGLIQP